MENKLRQYFGCLKLHSPIESSFERNGIRDSLKDSLKDTAQHDIDPYRIRTAASIACRPVFAL